MRIAPVSIGERTHRASQAGVGLLELLAVLALAGIVLAMASPALMEGLQRQKTRAVASEAVQVVRYAHMMALKEKVRHRVVFHDAFGSPRNTIQVQREQSGTFVTVEGHVYEAPNGVTILGSGDTDSVDSVVIGTRGECEAGKVFIQGHEIIEVVSIETTCYPSKETHEQD